MKEWREKQQESRKAPWGLPGCQIPGMDDSPESPHAATGKDLMEQGHRFTRSFRARPSWPVGIRTLG